MAKFERRERRDQDKFQSFSRPKVKVVRTSGKGKVFVDYKDTETLRRLLSGNGKIISRKRASTSAMEQRMVAAAIKRARYMALLPYISTGF